MDGITEFEFDRERQLAAVGLRPEHGSEFQRLLKLLIYGPKFQLLVAEANNGVYRRLLIEKIDLFASKFGLRVGRLQLDAGQHPDVAAMERALEGLAQSVDVIHVEGGEFWFDIPRWQSFNVRREAISQAVPVKLLFWLNTEPIRLFAQHAPDCWAWRSGVFSFLSPQGEEMRSEASLEFVEPNLSDTDNRTLAERANRIAQLEAVLKQTLAPALALPLLHELAGLYSDLGEVQEALRIRQERQLPMTLEVGAYGQAASIKWAIARHLFAFGQTSKGVALLRNEVLPVFRENGDQRRAALVLAEIAQAHDVNTDAEEMLRILNEEALPFFQKSGESELTAKVSAIIANILFTQGELDRAFDILQNQALPAFVALDDRRAIATAKQNMALILQSRGEYDEALRIYQQEVLPLVFDLGLERSVVEVHMNIALILLSQGKPERALLLLRDQVVPILQRTGAVRQLAKAQHLVAHCLMNLKQFSDAAKLLENDVLPIYEDLKMLSEVEQIQNELAQFEVPTAPLAEAGLNPALPNP